MKNNKKRSEPAGTKISPDMAEVLNACCDALHVDVYHMLQWFAYTVIRASAPHHELTPNIQKIMTMLESDTGWQTAFNLANPDKLKVAQVVLILEQENHQGFGAVMVDKPWMGKTMEQTENVDDILERVCEVTMRGIYRRLRLMGVSLECNNLSDILLTMLDAQDILNVTESDRAEGPQMGEYTEAGKLYAYGKKTKAKQHRTPDSLTGSAAMQPIIFGEYDKIQADKEAKEVEDD